MLDLFITVVGSLLLGAAAAFALFSLAFGGTWIVQAFIDSRRREEASWDRHYRGPRR